MFSTFGDIKIELDPSIMCRILGVLDEGNEVYDSPSYMDCWLVDCTFCSRKVNLGYPIVQHIVNVLSSSHSVLPYGMLLTNIFVTLVLT